MRKFKITDLLIWIVGAELYGAVSAIVGGNFNGFYDTLKMPPRSPPSWLFPVMWGIIYALLGASAYIVFKLSQFYERTTVAVFLTQLGINFCWNIIFFRMHKLWLAAVVLIALTISVGILVLEFYRRNKKAGLMNIPYLLWCAFACYLNIGIAMLN